MDGFSQKSRSGLRIKAIYRGSISSGASATIPAVNPAKCDLVMTGFSCSSGTPNAGDYCRLTLVNATTISCTSGHTINSPIANYQLTEYY